MRFALRTVPLLIIGFTLIGCAKDGGSDASRHQATVDQSRGETTTNQPMVTLKIPGMF
jgi:hypothetical protein